MAKGYVLDASALLAALFGEPGGAMTEAALEEAAMSAVNYGEVIAKLVRRGEDWATASRLVDDLELPVVPWDQDLARESGDLISLGWTHGLSLGDRACLATGRRMKRTVLTADRSWQKLRIQGVEVRVIR